LLSHAGMVTRNGMTLQKLSTGGYLAAGSARTLAENPH
jgi:hypothetical protein